MDTKLRSLLKAVSYRAMGSIVTSTLVLAVTKQATLAVSVVILDCVVKILAYFVHERLWAKIPYGRVGPGLIEIRDSGLRTGLDEEKQIAREKFKELGYLPK